ncbi:MAG: hypothetical protein AB1898_09530 [Acidobacteriota bacterium]
MFHSNNPRLGQTTAECSWNPVTWPDCLNLFRNARTELEISQKQVIDFARATQEILADAAAMPYTEEKPRIMESLGASATAARQLLTEHTALVNAFNAEVQKLSSIPGFSTIFLNGLPANSSGMSGLGVAWGVAAPYISTLVKLIADTIIFSYLLKVLGQIAQAFKSNYDRAAGEAKARAEYYLAYKEAMAKGGTPPPAPTSGGPDWLSGLGLSTTSLLVFGLAALFLIGIAKR